MTTTHDDNNEDSASGGKLVLALFAIMIFVIGVAAALPETPENPDSSSVQVEASSAPTAPEATASPSARPSPTTPATPSSSPAPGGNQFANLDPAALAKAELRLAANGGTCETLELWYAANPGDSNRQIAGHYRLKCGGTPPPVHSGELSPAEVDFSEDGGDGGTDAFIAMARGSGGGGWPYLSDGQLRQLAQNMCSTLAQGVPISDLVTALLEAGSGASRTDIENLVRAADNVVC